MGSICAGKSIEGSSVFLGKLKSDDNKTLADPEFKSLMKFWHPEKNGDLKPEHITPGSNKPIAFICDGCPGKLALVWSHTLGFCFSF